MNKDFSKISKNNIDNIEDAGIVGAMLNDTLNYTALICVGIEIQEDSALEKAITKPAGTNNIEKKVTVPIKFSMPESYGEGVYLHRYKDGYFYEVEEEDYKIKSTEEIIAYIKFIFEKTFIDSIKYITFISPDIDDEEDIEEIAEDCFKLYDLKYYCRVREGEVFDKQFQEEYINREKNKKYLYESLSKITDALEAIVNAKKYKEV